MSAAGPSGKLTPQAAPAWLKPLVENVGCVPAAYRRRLPADVLAMVTAANASATLVTPQVLIRHRIASLYLLVPTLRVGMQN